MVPDKGMKLHWFFTHISSILGTVFNGVMTVVWLLKMPESGFYFLDAVFSGAACWACIMSFIHRKEYSQKEYMYCVILWWIIIAYNTLTCIVSGESLGTLIGSVLVSILILIYYYRRKYIFTSGKYIYSDSNTVQPTIENNSSSSQAIDQPDVYVQPEQPCENPVNITREVPQSFVPVSKPEIESAPVTANEAEISEVLFCRKCGYKLKPDSVFCSRCGARVD